MATDKDINQLKHPSEVTCLVYDNGLFLSQAIKLAETYKKVYYYCPHESAFPTMNLSYIGYGYDEIEIVHSVFGSHMDEADLVYFPDVYAGELQEHLVNKLGKAVWGARLGDCMELSRDGMKSIMEALDLPVGKWWKIKGMDNLRAFLKDNNDVYVKINKWRGCMETFHSYNYDYIEPKLDELEYKLGPLKYVIEFIVEANLKDKVEWGSDGWVIDGEYPSKQISGIEVKDKAYCGVFKDVKDIPAPLLEFNNRMKPVYKAYGWRGYVSTEIRIGDDHKGYQIDLCARAGSPPSELYQNFYTNLAECVWYGANGIIIEPTTDFSHGCEILVHSTWADKNWMPVLIPEDIRDKVKLRNSMKIKGVEYCAPQSTGLPEIGAVVGLGNTLEEAIQDAVETGQRIKGHYIEIPESAADEAREEIKKLKDIGLDAFGD